MGRILPTSDTPTDGTADPRLVCLDEDWSEEILAAIQSHTARLAFRELMDDPLTPSELADRLDVTVENASYHLDNLEEAELVDVVDTVYSEKGREMSVYGPSREPPVLFFGAAADEDGLRSAFSDLVPVIGPIAVVIALKGAISRSLDLGDLLGEVP